MNRYFKWIIIAASAVIVLFLAMEAMRENLNTDWQRYQNKYKSELKLMAKTEQEREIAADYEIKMRQIVAPHLGRSDRCISCHVAMEDSRMVDMENPLKSHPGDYLDKHDMNFVGCTSCHDGQGRAITAEAAHARGSEHFWEKPLLDGSFIESTCTRCHASGLDQSPHYNLGKQLFNQKGCFACHSVGDVGGVKGPALSDIGDASFHVKMPTHENRERLLDKFNQNVNLAYIYEAITEPAAQPEETEMQKVEFLEDEVTALMVYLKSLSSDRRMMDVGVADSRTAETGVVLPVQTKALSSAKVSGGAAKGYLLFQKNCIACHTIGGGDRVGPDLKGVTERREGEWLKKFIQYPTDMINAKDPIVMDLMKKYPTPMVNMGLSEEDVEEILKYLRNPEDVEVEESVATTPESASKIAPRAQINKGLDLFRGKQRFLNGGPSCMVCHHVRNASLFGGGSLAKEVTTSYSRLGDAGVKGILKNPPFPLMKEAYKGKPLTEDEVDALTAFLQESDREEGNQSPRDHKKIMVLAGVAGLVFLFLLLAVAGARRKKDSVNKNLFNRQKKSEDGI